MKVLLINGSPRWKGNTNRALEEAAAALQAEGVETELVWIAEERERMGMSGTSKTFVGIGCLLFVLGFIVLIGLLLFGIL